MWKLRVIAYNVHCEQWKTATKTKDLNEAGYVEDKA